MADDDAVTIEIGVQGMTCASCSARIERALSKRSDVLSAEVHLLQERARIRVVPGTTVEKMFEAIEATGFVPKALPKKATAELFADEEAEFARAARRDGWLLLLSIAMAVPLVLPMFGMVLGLHLHLAPWLQFALATPVQFLLGARFYRAGFRAAMHGAGNMDLLVALGTSAAYAYSVAEMLRDRPGAELNLYFEASAVVITLVRLGKWLESRAKRGTTVALRELLRLRPTTVRIRREKPTTSSKPEFLESEIFAEELEPGMLMVVRPGERFAADGIVIEGKAAIDESMLTGESLPVQRTPGEPVLSGSLDVNGLVIAQVTRAGDDATLGRIIQMVQGAQAGKAKLQQLVDRISAWFVPVVLAVAVVTFVAWWFIVKDFEQALVAAVSVLVIACPCALGLATPTAIVAGTGAAARAGILVRDIDTLQLASRIDSVVFDKTGTLTEGRPSVVEIRAIEGDERELLRLASSVEQASTHPLAVAIVAAAKQRGITPANPSDFEEHIGAGASGMVDGELIRVGRLSWLGQCGVTTTDASGAPPSTTNAAPRPLYGAVGIARDTVLLGTLAISDRLRDTAKPAISALRARGVRVAMLSGDDERIARALADELGIEDAIGRARPEHKQQYVERMATEGRRLAMVGDGINDAPALAAADVGVAIGGGTEVAMQTAKIVILRPDLRLIPAALDVAAATFRKIRQNLFWAFVYNCVGIPLAATGRLTPMLAGLAMAMSSVSVVSNSLLLRRWRPRSTD